LAAVLDGVSLWRSEGHPDLGLIKQVEQESRRAVANRGSTAEFDHVRVAIACRRSHGPADLLRVISGLGIDRPRGRR
jgi:hypothetical protein